MRLEEATVHPMIKVDLWEAVKALYRFKLKIHANLFGVVVLLMFVAGNLSSSGNYSISGSGYITVGIHEQSNVGIVVYLVMMLIVGIRLTTNYHWLYMQSYRADKRTDHFANILLLFTLSLVTGIMSIFMHYAYRLFTYFTTPITESIVQLDKITIGSLFIAIVVTFFYAVFISALGYLAGEFIQFSKMFIIPIIIVFFIVINSTELSKLNSFLAFYLEEANVLLFLLKMTFTILIIFGIAMVLNRNKEVRA